MSLKTLTRFLVAIAAVAGALPAFGQSINVGTPIHTRNYFDRTLPLQDWKCSVPQLDLGTVQLQFFDTDGTPGDYVDCHGRIHGGGGGSTCPGDEAVPTQILYDNGGVCAGIPTSGVDVPGTRVLWQYYESFGPPISSMNPYFGPGMSANLITNVSTIAQSGYALGIYEEDDGVTGFADGLVIQPLETGDEGLVMGLYVVAETTGNSSPYGEQIDADYMGPENISSFMEGSLIETTDFGGNTIGENIALEAGAHNLGLHNYDLKLDSNISVNENYGLVIGSMTGGTVNDSVLTDVGLVSFGDWTSSGTDTYTNLLAQTALLPGEGFQKNCSDCDTPPYAGAPCSDTFDEGGAVAVYIQGGLYCYGKIVGSGVVIANIETTIGTTLIPANTCTDPPTSLAMTGVVAGTNGSTFGFTAQTDTNAVVGWGSTNGLQFIAWPTTDTVNFRVCNITASDITPSDSVTFNISAK